VNAAILRVYGLIVVLFILLVAFTSRWTVFDAKALRDNALNRRELLQELKIQRGKIYASDGHTVLARSVPEAGHTWGRTYPFGPLLGQPVGFANTALGQRSGLERSRDDFLTGRDNEFSSILDQLRGRPLVGDDVVTTLDPAAQRVAYQGLAGREGAVVAMVPQTGAIRVMAANPNYDPNHPTQGGSTFNRATQGSPGYPPGSTFKTVTAVAGIDSGKYSPSSVLDGSSPKTISGVPLSNDGGESFGSIDLTTALTNSVNTVWAQVAVNVGKPTMAKYMKRFGFYAKPPLDYPADQRTASGEFGSNGKLLDPESDSIDVGRMGIGQDKLAVTPLQMAMVASAIGNGGTLMKPHLTDRIVDPDGRTVDRVQPSVMATVMKKSTADQVNQMMQNVVREGTGTAAALTGIDVAGKTGTAEVGCDGGAPGVQTWFIAFAPATDPKIAVAVTVRCSGGVGGTVAAPIAKSVMENLLQSG
jgi:peptidoglycan glycosyltransferase